MVKLILGKVEQIEAELQKGVHLGEKGQVENKLLN